MSAPYREYILTIRCPDVPGIVAGVSAFIAAQHGFIMELTQYGDPASQRFFMRTHFHTSATSPDDARLKQAFAEQVGQPFAMDWQLYDALHKPRLMLMVSKFSHCLNTLLHRYQNGTLSAEIALVVSNHPDLQRLVAWYDIPFYHLPIGRNGKESQEARVRELAEDHAVELLVLARYMQVLTPAMCQAFAGRAMNIHHSFLPSFKGAKPYHQAHARGVKLIGATAHYVTEDLDEGPIIEQEVARVTHTHTVDELISVGQEIESTVLYRAVRYHTEHRVLINGNKTVCFT